MKIQFIMEKDEVHDINVALEKVFFSLVDPKTHLFYKRSTLDGKEFTIPVICEEHNGNVRVTIDYGKEYTNIVVGKVVKSRKLQKRIRDVKECIHYGNCHSDLYSDSDEYSPLYNKEPPEMRPPIIDGVEARW